MDGLILKDFGRYADEILATEVELIKSSVDNPAFDSPIIEEHLLRRLKAIGATVKRLKRAKQGSPSNCQTAFVTGGGSETLKVLTEWGVQKDILSTLTTAPGCFGDMPFRAMEELVNDVTHDREFLVEHTKLELLQIDARALFCELLAENFLQSLNSDEQDEVARMMKGHVVLNNRRGIAVAAFRHWNEQLGSNKVLKGQD